MDLRNRSRDSSPLYETLVMAEADPTDVPPVGQADAFGPPHEHAISETLQLWILIPGLIGLVLIGESLDHRYKFIAGMRDTRLLWIPEASSVGSVRVCDSLI